MWIWKEAVMACFWSLLSSDSTEKAGESYIDQDSLYPGRHLNAKCVPHQYYPRVLLLHNLLVLGARDGQDYRFGSSWRWEVKGSPTCSCFLMPDSYMIHNEVGQRKGALPVSKSFHSVMESSASAIVCSLLNRRETNQLLMRPGG
jgi:hypothetical protein